MHGGNESATLYTKLKDINKYYAHYVSRKVVDFCVKQGLRLLWFRIMKQQLILGTSNL